MATTKSFGADGEGFTQEPILSLEFYFTLFSFHFYFYFFKFGILKEIEMFWGERKIG